LFARGWVVLGLLFCCSSRRRHTRSKRDWSSDVCSSDLYGTWWGCKTNYKSLRFVSTLFTWWISFCFSCDEYGDGRGIRICSCRRSEERRVGNGVGGRVVGRVA